MTTEQRYMRGKIEDEYGKKKFITIVCSDLYGNTAVDAGGHGGYPHAVFCQRCGIRVSKQQYTKTNGLCENCFAMTIDL